MKILLFVILFLPNFLIASPIKSTWEQSLVFEPNSGRKITINDIGSDKKFPVILFMHGCTGLNPSHPTDYDAWGKEISKQGFLVIFPNSFARPDRLANCDPAVPGKSGSFPKAYQYRQEEIDYAIFELRNSPWADTKNVFVMGHSEGGNVVSRANTDFFKAVIISGWTCTHKTNPRFDGINYPTHIPVMAIAYVDDPFRKGKPTEGRCADKGNGRKVLQIDLKGSGHSTYNEKTRSAVIDFLKNNLDK